MGERALRGAGLTCQHEAEAARLAHLIHRVAQEAEVVESIPLASATGGYGGYDRGRWRSDPDGAG